MGALVFGLFIGHKELSDVVVKFFSMNIIIQGNVVVMVLSVKIRGASASMALSLPTLESWKLTLRRGMGLRSGLSMVDLPSALI